PGLTGRLYAQFALVIAATALISAVNAATLKPTQCALWLRKPVEPELRNAFYRGFNRAYAGLERRYVALIARMVRRSGLMAALGLILGGLGVAGIAALPTGFLPLEDQGYLLVAVQLPGGASLERTQHALDRVGQLARAVPGVSQVIGIAGVSVLDNSAPEPNAGVASVMLRDWSERGSKEGLRALYTNLNAAMGGLREAQAVVIVPPAIQGIGNSGGFTEMVELRNNSEDFGRLQALTDAIVDRARSQPAVQHVDSTFRADVPQFNVAVDRVKAETLQVSVGDVFQALSTYLGSSFIGQVTKFGRTFQIYTQADARFRDLPEDVAKLNVRNAAGQMIPLGTLVHLTPTIGPSLITLYNLYPSATIVGAAANGFSSGQALDAMDRVTAATLPPGTGSEWTAMSYQEKAIGGQIYVVFGLALVLVYLVLAGQYESWRAPLSVILAVPLSLIGPALVLGGVGAGNNLYTQIGLVLLIALSAKNAILIVEVAREARLRRGLGVIESAMEGARTRLRPILMTSFAFALGM
ncbi:MAG: efflux RND transporter permease subunit, partial [Acetobacteraceae bacterium]